MGGRLQENKGNCIKINCSKFHAALTLKGPCHYEYNMKSTKSNVKKWLTISIKLVVFYCCKSVKLKFEEICSIIIEY